MSNVIVSTMFTCDVCGSTALTVHPAALAGRGALPDGWRRLRGDQDADIHFCTVECARKNLVDSAERHAAELFGVDMTKPLAAAVMGHLGQQGVE